MAPWSSWGLVKRLLTDALKHDVRPGAVVQQRSSTSAHLDEAFLKLGFDEACALLTNDSLRDHWRTSLHQDLPRSELFDYARARDHDPHAAPGEEAAMAAKIAAVAKALTDCAAENSGLKQARTQVMKIKEK